VNPAPILGAGWGSSNAVTASRDYEGHDHSPAENGCYQASLRSGRRPASGDVVLGANAGLQHWLLFSPSISSGFWAPSP